MMQRLSALAIAASLAILASSGAAHAASTANLTITGFSITLVDTDLTDGISPSLTFIDSSGRGHGTYVYTVARYFHDDGSESDDTLDRGTFQGIFLAPNAANATVSRANSSAAVTADSVQLSAFSTVSIQSSIHDAAYAEASMRPDWGGAFTLSANTTMIVEASYSLMANVEVAPVGFLYDEAAAMFSLRGTIFFPGAGPFPGSDQFFLNKEAVAFNLPGESPTVSVSGQFSESLHNHTGAAVRGFLTLDARVVTVDANVTPIPEATSYVQALTGLGVLGAVAARRRRA